MEKKVVYLLLIFIIFNLANYLFVFVSLTNIKHSFATGRASISTGTLHMYIEGGLPYEVIIFSPQNTTYYFDFGDIYSIDLNVSANFSVDLWKYKHEDLKHNTVLVSNSVFSPNITFNATRWSNRITVTAIDSNGSSASASVIFFVYVPNTSPILGPIPNRMQVCEDDSFSLNFNATDYDEDNLTISVSPIDPFFVYPLNFYGEIYVYSQLFSNKLTKNLVRNYSEIISVNDNEGHVDSKQINITVIEINHAPVIFPVGVHTIYTRGENRSFYHQLDIEDIESGNNLTSGNFSINLTFFSGTPFFNISSDGVMNFTGNESDIGIYNLSLCVVDQDLPYIHPNISLCFVDGLKMTNCTNFSITVTNDNRAPIITYTYPGDNNVSADSTDMLYFNASYYDPDGTTPDSYFFVDNQMLRYNPNSNNDSFRYTFGCGASGLHFIELRVTDGLQNSSFIWNVSIASVRCGGGTDGGGGGGGGGGRNPPGSCKEKWACKEWSICRRFNELDGIIYGKDINIKIQQQCGINLWGREICGIQTRQCDEQSTCNSSFNKPIDVQACQLSSAPTCDDGIKNCHDKGCEILADCGGPCKACPTCSDGVKNQGEFGIDCGGPCPRECRGGAPILEKRRWALIILVILNILLILYLTYRVFRFLIIKKRSKEKEETANKEIVYEYNGQTMQDKVYHRKQGYRKAAGIAAILAIISCYILFFYSLYDNSEVISGLSIIESSDIVSIGSIVMFLVVIVIAIIFFVVVFPLIRKSSTNN